MTIKQKIRDAYNHINMGIAEIEVGTRVGDPDRVGWGWATVDDALLSLEGMRVNETDLRMELHRAAMELWEIAEPHLVGTEDAVRYMRARERFQTILSALVGEAS